MAAIAGASEPRRNAQRPARFIDKDKDHPSQRTFLLIDAMGIGNMNISTYDRFLFLSGISQIFFSFTRYVGMQ